MKTLKDILDMSINPVLDQTNIKKHLEGIADAMDQDISLYEALSNFLKLPDRRYNKLDYIGMTLGIYRPEIDVSKGLYFGFDVEDPNLNNNKGFDEGIFKGEYTGLLVPLPDSRYQSYLDAILRVRYGAYTHNDYIDIVEAIANTKVKIEFDDDNYITLRFPLESLGSLVAIDIIKYCTLPLNSHIKAIYDKDKKIYGV